jgi:hypothetical protein
MKKIIGNGVKIVIAITVMAFLGMKSLNFFLFTTPLDQWYLSWLGFGLTGGGVIAYLIIFLWDADTDLKKAVSLIMLIVCVFGELATAGFGLQVDTWQKTGFAMAESDFSAMVFAVQLLGFFHALALIIYIAGDKIGAAFADKNHNGIPDGFERKHQNQQRPQNMPQRQFAEDEKQVKLDPTLAERQDKPPRP